MNTARNPGRAALLLVLLPCVATVAWGFGLVLLGLPQAGPDPAGLALAHRFLCLGQALVLVMVAPDLDRHAGTALGQAGVPLLVPLPLHLLAWRMGLADRAGVVDGALSVLLPSLVASVIIWVLAGRAESTMARTVPLTVAVATARGLGLALVIAGAALAWAAP